jgi:predicted  nucleic acid-binding Zn-ribbon protein
MATRQGSQSNAMLYSLITFVALFIAATVCAVIFYVKSEEYRTNSENAMEDLAKVANVRENSNLTKIVGKPESGASYIGTMQTVVNQLYTMILGKAVPESTPATVMLNEISMAVKNSLIDDAAITAAPLGQDGIAIIQSIEDLKQTLRNEQEKLANLTAINDGLQADLEDAQAQIEQERAQFLEELSQFQNDYNQIRDRFNELQQNMQDSTDEQIQAFQDKLEAEQARLRQKQLDLQAAESKLTETNELLGTALTKLEEIKPKPNIEVQAFEPDAQIVRIDLQNGIVYLDAGTQDHIYRGLTFAIYDRNKPIPESGEGKAEIEVFQVNEQASAARIIKSDRKNPIVMEDIVSNLIWDSKTSNSFVVIGEFDFNNDGRTEPDGKKRIIELIHRWGGSVMDTVTVDTDFLVIGQAPAPMQRPTQDEIDIDPMAQQRYEQSLQKINDYNALLKKANDLSIPVFNQKRFMYLIGYNTLVTQNPGQ